MVTCCRLRPVSHQWFGLGTSVALVPSSSSVAVCKCGLVYVSMSVEGEGVLTEDLSACPCTEVGVHKALHM